jgi:hypothetical protein
MEVVAEHALMINGWGIRQPAALLCRASITIYFVSF